MVNGLFPARLSLIMKALSISRGRLSADLGVDKSVIARWLNGATLPTGHNLSRLTALIAAQRPGFTMLDWEGEMSALAAKVGASEISGETGIASFGAWPPASMMRAAAAATAARGEAYEGFWRSTRLANDPPGRFIHDRVLIRRGPGGLLTTRMGVLEMRFEGVAFINQTQLFGMTVDADSGIFVFTVHNTIPRQRAEAMDGLTLTCTQKSGGAPVAGATYLERTGLLSGDEAADDARFEASLDEDPFAPEGSVPPDVSAHLFRDVGPAAFAAGGDAMLSMAFGRSLARAIDPRAAPPG